MASEGPPIEEVVEVEVEATESRVKYENAPVELRIPSIVSQDEVRFSQNVTKRKLLRDWLQEHLNKGTFAGVVWVDREKSIFKIPWLHRAKPGWREEHAIIFKEWSRYSGKLNPKDNEATLKTRFRCAITKAHDIEYMKQSSLTDDENCYRVYRLKSKEEMRRTRRPALDNSVALESMYANRYVHQGPPTTVPQEQLIALSMEQNATPTFVTQPTHTVRQDESSNPMYFVPHSAEHSSLDAVQSDMEVDMSGIMPQEIITTKQLVNKPTNTKPEPVTQRARNQYFTVDLYYDGKRVASRPFKEGVTCKICPRSSSNAADRTALHMPAWDDKKYRTNDPAKIEMFFQNIGDGIDIELDTRGNLYAIRRCLVRVFYSSFLKYQLSPQLKRGERSLIFSLEEFAESLQTLNQDDRTTSMCSCEVYIGFGRPWIFRDGDEKMTFIAAKIKSSEAEARKNMKLMDETEHRTNSLTISDSLPENATRMGEECALPDLK